MWLRPKWPGGRWRPGLDLANLGLLLAGAIIIKALWDTHALERWLPAEFHVAVRWVLAVLVVLWALLDVLGGLGDFRDGIQRGARQSRGSSQRDSDNAAV